MKRNDYLFLALFAFIFTWLFTGIYYDDEFSEKSFFDKYKPSLKVFYRTPIMQSDLRLEDLNPEDKKEELLYQDFVVHRKSDVISLYGLRQPMLFQLTATLLVVGIYTTFNTVRPIRSKSLLLHFIVCFLLTNLGCEFLLIRHTTVTIIGILLLILLVNYALLIALMSRHKKQRI